MAYPRRGVLLALALLLFGVGVVTVVAEQPTRAAAVALAPSPILQVAPPTTVAPTTVPPTTVAPPTTSPPSPAPEVERRVTTGPVAPPRDAYVPEPIREIGRIQIPKIGLDHKMMEGISLRNIDLGPSHWPGTPMPGEQGNTVIAGHRTTHSRPFFRLNELVPGDEIIFTVNGVRSRYLVTGHEIVVPTRVDIVNPTPDPIVTLFACHPPGSARYRYVVRGALQPPEPPAPDADAAAAATP